MAVELHYVLSISLQCKYSQFSSVDEQIRAAVLSSAGCRIFIPFLHIRLCVQSHHKPANRVGTATSLGKANTICLSPAESNCMLGVSQWIDLLQSFEALGPMTPTSVHVRCQKCSVTEHRLLTVKAARKGSQNAYSPSPTQDLTVWVHSPTFCTNAGFINESCCQHL